MAKDANAATTKTKKTKEKERLRAARAVSSNFPGVKFVLKQ